MIVKDIMHKKVEIINSSLTVTEVCKRMSELNIGNVIVGSAELMEGVFSERDLMKKVVAKGLDVEKTKISDVMTKGIFIIKETESIEQALDIMEKKKIRHLPVINKKGSCVGMLGIRDLMSVMLKKLEEENKVMLEFLLSLSRVAMLINELSERAGIEENGQIVIKHNITKSEFQELTNTSKKIFDKALRTLKIENIIDTSRNKIIIFNKDMLQKKII